MLHCYEKYAQTTRIWPVEYWVLAAAAAASCCCLLLLLLLFTAHLAVTGIFQILSLSQGPRIFRGSGGGGHHHIIRQH